MANILTATEASNALRCAANDASMLDLLPQVDRYIEHATGRNWTLDNPVYPEAKAAARMLLVKWHEDQAQIGGALGYGLAAALTQLEALALTLETSGIPDEDLYIRASAPASGASEVSVDVAPVVVFNHQMDAGATAAAVLVDASGATVATVNTLDATGKILTLTPGVALAAASSYIVVITAAADVYGQTITDEVRFRTA